MPRPGWRPDWRFWGKEHKWVEPGGSTEEIIMITSRFTGYGRSLPRELFTRIGHFNFTEVLFPLWNHGLVTMQDSGRIS